MDSRPFGPLCHYASSISAHFYPIFPLKMVIFQALGRFELSDVANDHYQKIQYKVKKVKVQTDCDVRTWGATLEEFDLFLRVRLHFPPYNIKL